MSFSKMAVPSGVTVSLSSGNWVESGSTLSKQGLWSRALGNIGLVTELPRFFWMMLSKILHFRFSVSEQISDRRSDWTVTRVIVWTLEATIDCDNSFPSSLFGPSILPSFGNLLCLHPILDRHVLHHYDSLELACLSCIKIHLLGGSAAKHEWF